jgi:toxin ParE1/3/4
LAGRRRAASSHILFYKREAGGIVVLRILHEAMEFGQHLRPVDES